MQKCTALFMLKTKIYIFLVVVVVVLVFKVVSFAVVSFTSVSTFVVSVVAILPSVVLVVSEPEPVVLLEVQAATDKEIAKAKKPNLKDFFIGANIELFDCLVLIQIRQKNNLK